MEEDAASITGGGMTDSAESEDETDGGDSADTPHAVPIDAMLGALADATGTDFAAYETRYGSYAARAQLAVQELEFYDRVVEIHERLSTSLVAGKIRAIENWSGGESEFRIVAKSWSSLVDKLYRINREENALYSQPPIVPTIEDRARKLNDGRLQRWITPEIAHEVVDDLLRMKFVVPFVDGVVDVGDQITGAIDEFGLMRFVRFHAKDTGYHARHYYILLPVPGDDETPETTVALEIKVLTKMQDMLGELTHILYEKHRTGEIPLAKKRKLAWEFASPDFLASYLGHSGHLLEATICELKDEILKLGAPG